jgi:hypothetical protein
VRKARPTVEGTFIKVHCARGGGGYFDIRGVGADFLLLYAPSEDGSGEDEFALKRCPKEAAGGPASAAAPTYWKLDRSIVYLQADGSSRKFFYESPGPALQRLGVRRGALVFAGEAVDHVIEGEAYVYTHRCGPLGYVVSGPLKEGADRLTLRGGAPTVDKDCHAKGRRRSVLEFRLIGQRPSPKETQR